MGQATAKLQTVDLETQNGVTMTLYIIKLMTFCMSLGSWVPNSSHIQSPLFLRAHRVPGLRMTLFQLFFQLAFYSQKIAFWQSWSVYAS